MTHEEYELLMIFKLSAIGTSDWSGIARFSVFMKSMPYIFSENGSESKPLPPQYEGAIVFELKDDNSSMDFTWQHESILVVRRQLLISLGLYLGEPVIAIPFSGLLLKRYP